ncbi:hypothetical protein D3C84_951830 [compost metagenome]
MVSTHIGHVPVPYGRVTDELARVLSEATPEVEPGRHPSQTIFQGLHLPTSIRLELRFKLLLQNRVGGVGKVIDCGRCLTRNVGFAAVQKQRSLRITLRQPVLLAPGVHGVGVDGAQCDAPPPSPVAIDIPPQHHETV